MSSTRARFASDLDQLLLGPTTTALVASDARHFLEQRTALLRSEGEGLIDHPLPDEQEGVVGEVRRIEQVHEVAQADPALVEEVVVLARAVEPAPELEDLELDRQEPVGVVDHERDVGHPLRGALLRAGPDDVLRLARAERPTLLAERPAEGVGEVALARAVGPDDGADPAPEFDARPLGERLEALHAEGEEARFGGSLRLGHARSPSVVSGGAFRRRSIAWAAAAVSALRRDGPSPTPSRSPFTQTSIRKDFSWSGPLASVNR